MRVMRLGVLNDRSEPSRKSSFLRVLSGAAELMSRLARLGFIDIRRTSDPVRRKVRSRGVPPALANNEIFYTESVREAGSLLSQALAPGQITVHQDASGF